jgi:hypothetical protein
MKRLILFVLFVLLTFALMAQTKIPTYKVGNDNKLIGLKVEKDKVAVMLTPYTLVLNDTLYNVYKTSNNKYFIVRLSKKTGNSYKYYINIK